jgi:hypothetical protein
MIRRSLTAILLAWVSTVHAEEPTLEYRVKAAFIFNFVQYVEWPEEALGEGALNICVAGHNPFGSALAETVQGETVHERPVVVRVILEPEPGCHVIFVANGSATSAYLRAVRQLPVLTIGESADFMAQGGMIGFVLEGANVRFVIDQHAAERANLRISSRLLRLARMPNARGGSQ